MSTTADLERAPPTTADLEHAPPTIIQSCQTELPGFAEICHKSFPQPMRHNFAIIMHPPRGPKGRGVAPIGATRGMH